jgi:predicted nucleotidyltransferase component of viral defense system
MPKAPRDIAASVRDRLFNLSKQRKQPFDLILTRYAIERLLYRLTQTKHKDRFALKGAMLMTTWFEDPHRPTRDLDLLGFGDPNPEAVLQIFREVCAVPGDDGIVFDVDGLKVEEIRDEQEYGGVRIKTTADLKGARINVAIDVGFGDAIEPGLAETDYPVLLDFPAPHLKTYARETVTAEKFQAMVDLGRANSRMKDFYDIWLLSRTYEFKGDALARAIAATFARRNTQIPEAPPDPLTPAFAQDAAKIQQWNSFVENVAFKPDSLAKVIDDLAGFLMPHAAAARGIRKK